MRSNCMETLKGCEQGFLKQILDILPVGVLILEAPLGNIIMSNEEMERIHMRKFPIPTATDEYMEWRLFLHGWPAIQARGLSS